MAIINNTVEGFVHSDNDIRLQPPGTARESVNGRIISYGDGNYSWENISGDLFSFSLKENFEEIGFIELTDKIIVFSTADETEAGGKGEIGRLTFVNNTATYVPIYTSNDLNFSKQHRINGFGLKETDNIERIYWTDNNNPPRTLNIGEYVPLKNGRAELGVTYLVNLGTVNQSSTLYTEGSTFVGDYTVITGNGYYVKYIPVSNMEIQPDVQTPIIDYLEPISGTLPEGGYFIAVRLGLEDGYRTPFMYVSQNITAFDDGAGDNHVAYQRTKLYNDNRITNQGFRFNIANIDQKYDFYEVVLFKTTNWDEIKGGKIALKNDITTTSETFDVTSYDGFGDVGFEDIIINPIRIDLVKSMTMIKNMSSIGNIKERQEPNTNQSLTANLADEVYELPVNSVSIQGTSTAEGIPLLGGKKVGTIATGDIIPGQWYKVTNTSITYNTVTYNVDDVFQGVDSVTAFTGGGTPIPIIRIKKYYDNVAGAIIYDDHVLTDWYDYKSRMIANKMVGYWDDKYRFGVMLFDLKGYPMFVRWIGDHEFPLRQQDIDDTNTFDSRTPLSAEISKKRPTGLSAPYDYTWNAKIMSLIVNDLDLTDVIDKIGAFAIVRSGIETSSSGEAVLQRIFKDSANSLYKQYQTIEWSRTNPAKQLYKITTPEISIGWLEIENGNQEDIRLQRYLPAENYVTHSGTDGNHTYELEEIATGPIGGSSVTPGELNTIKSAVKVEVPTDMSSVPEYEVDSLFGYKYKNENDQGGPAVEGYIISTTRDEDGVDLPITGFGDSEPVLGVPAIVKILKRSQNAHVNTNQSLENSLYQFTGHYQVVDDAFKAAIYKGGGRYVVDSIQVFGGDCYVGMFSYLDSYEYSGAIGASEYYGAHLMIQSKINLALLGTRSFAEYRTYDTSTMTAGIRYYDSITPEYTPNKWENREFNLSAITTAWGSGIRYPGLPENLNLITRHERKIRYSEVKFDGEDIDSFRRFLADNEVSLNHFGGPITIIKSKNDKLYFWQQRMVGYIPVGERTLKTSEVGLPVQLGVGGKFDRVEDIYKSYGCIHMNSVVETDVGFFWYSFEKNAIVFMSYELGLTPESKIKGLDHELNNVIPIEIGNTDTPSIGEGVITGFDPKMEVVYMTFLSGSFAKTYGFNSKTAKFSGTYSLTPKTYMSLYGKLLSSTLDQVYHHGIGQKGVFHGIESEAYIDLILSQDAQVKKIFLNGQIIGDEINFDEIIYNFDYSYNTRSFNNSVAENTTGKYYERLLDSLNFAFPLWRRKRIDGHFIMIRLKVASTNRNLVKLLNLRTEYKIYL